MIKYFCDCCSKETQESDLAILTIIQANKPKITPEQICVFCQEKIKKFIVGIKVENDA